MIANFDTLSFAKRLTEAGEKETVAEAHAFALKELVMDNLATKQDLIATRDDFAREFFLVREEIGHLREDMTGKFASVEKEFTSVREEMAGGFTSVREEMAGGFSSVREEMDRKFASVDKEFISVRGEIVAVRDDLTRKIDQEITLVRKDMAALGERLDQKIDTMGLTLTVRMGGMLVIAVGVLATLNKIL